MTISTVFALLLSGQALDKGAAATPILTPQDSARSAKAAKIQQTAQALSGCIGPKVSTVAPTLTPEQGADSVMAACKAEQTELQKAVEAMIDAASPDQQAGARKQLADGMTQAKSQVAGAIRQSRVGTSATPPK